MVIKGYRVGPLLKKTVREIGTDSRIDCPGHLSNRDRFKLLTKPFERCNRARLYDDWLAVVRIAWRADPNGSTARSRVLRLVEPPGVEGDG